MILGTDMDRTLLPNGKQEYDNSMQILRRIVSDKNLEMVYVTGRNINEAIDGMIKYNPPPAEFVVAEVGTRIYKRENESYTEDENWIDRVARMTKNWDITAFKDTISEVPGMRLQDEFRQNRFKLSYYLDDPETSGDAIDRVIKGVNRICRDATVIYSVDETNNVGFVDILPVNATKITAMEYLRESEGLGKEEVIYAGDSGNDLLPLTFGYKSILVRNAIDEVKQQVRDKCEQDNISGTLYIAKGLGGLNGYYVSGVIEGLIHFGIAEKRYVNFTN